MAPEDITGQPDESHPEVSDNPEDMFPASEHTKQSLLDEVNNKLDGIPEDHNRTAIGLSFPEPERGTLTVERYKEGTNSNDARRVALIHRIEWPGKLYGERLIANFFLLRSPDGLQMEKFTTRESPTARAHQSDSLDEVQQKARELLASIPDIREAQAAERELGLSFVSERDAKDLLALLIEAQPIQ
jgi:hypothetical protein